MAVEGRLRDHGLNSERVLWPEKGPGAFEHVGRAAVGYGHQRVQREALALVEDLEARRARAVPEQRAGRDGGRLLPYPAVDAFAQQIGVAAVAGVLLDPVNPQLPDSDAVLDHPRAQIRIPG